MADDRKSVLSTCSLSRSIAPSIMLHDFHGKKSKIIQTLKQIDDLKSGMVKFNVIANLLTCLDVEIDQVELDEYQRRVGLTHEGITYIKYENMLRLMQYDNHTERWTIKNNNQDYDTLSVIDEKTRGGRRGLSLRQSYDGAKKKPSLQRESLRKALRASANVLSTDALSAFDRSRPGDFDAQSHRAGSIRKPQHDGQSVAKSRSTTFSELVQLRQPIRGGSKGPATVGQRYPTQNRDNLVSYPINKTDSYMIQTINVEDQQQENPLYKVKKQSKTPSLVDMKQRTGK